MLLKKCSVSGCENPQKSKTYCGNHYALWRRNGVPQRISAPVFRPDFCSVEGCGRKHSAKGFCSKHYARWVKYGETVLPVKEVWVCAVSGCKEKKHKAYGMCRFHYERAKEGRRLEMPKIIHSAIKICAIDGCGQKRRANRFCNKHYLRMINHGDPNFSSARRNHGSGKEWHVITSGYVVRYEPENPNAGTNGQVYQHRHVMAEMIGRPLQKNENVHHVNGDRADNRPQNLELWTRGQPAGQRIQDRVRWHIVELGKGADAAVLIDESLRVELQALALRLNML
jgi:hypothetical protein